MNTAVIYPGRFQPMLSHHAQVYNQLQASFPGADVYVGTSDKVDGEKSPFDFEDKRKIMQAHGISADNVLMVRSPYNASSYDFDMDNTILIFVVGEKDLDRFPFNNVDPETGLDMTARGEPKAKYLQKLETMDQGALPMSQRGYIALAPTIKTGNEIASASAFRQSLKTAPDVEAAKELFVKQFGQYDDKVFDLIYNKIMGNNMNTMNEQMITLRKMAGLPVEEGAPVNMSPGYEMTSKQRTLAGIGQILSKNAESESDEQMSNAMAQMGGKLARGEITTTEDLVSFIKSYKVQKKKVRGDQLVDPDDLDPLSAEQKATLSARVSTAMAMYSKGERAMGIKRGEEPEGYDDPEDEEVMDSVDLSDIRDEYGIEEDAFPRQSHNHNGDHGTYDPTKYKDSDFSADIIVNQKNFDPVMARVTGFQGGQGFYAEIHDIDDKGNPEAQTNGEQVFIKQNGQVVNAGPDTFDGVVADEASKKKLAALYSRIDPEDITEFQTNEAACKQCGATDCKCPEGECNCPPVEEASKTVSQMTPAEKKAHDERRKEYNEYQKGKRNEEVEEQAVEETADNAMAAAMAELRKLAGI